jgi:hypothetical protein
MEATDGRPPVQLADEFDRRLPVQLGEEQVTEEPAVPVPALASTERTHERVRALQSGQQPLAAGPDDECIGQLTTDTAGDRTMDQHLLCLGRLQRVHLVEQVVGHTTVPTVEPSDELIGVRGGAQRQRGQSQTSGPPLRPLVQRGELLLADRAFFAAEQLPQLGFGERQVRGAYLAQLTVIRQRSSGSAGRPR